jgi:hypothetical protein
VAAPAATLQGRNDEGFLRLLRVRTLLLPCSQRVRYPPRFASDSKAVAKASGSFRPRLPARRRIPAAAFGLSEYLDRSPLVSKTSDKEDATASLGNSEVLSVQHSTRSPVAEGAQVVNDRGEVISVVDR